MPDTPIKPVSSRLLLVAVAFALAFTLPGNAQGTPTPTKPAQSRPVPAKPRAAHPRSTAKKAFGGQVQSAPAVPAPVETPRWPVNEAASPAVIKWDAQGLQVNAANSSLRQILTDISTRTGAKLEGLGSDERVYGQYGPGRAGDVIAQLLHGSGYNVMLVGEQGGGTPKEIILSHRGASVTTQPQQPDQSQDSEEDVEPEPQPEEQPAPMPVARPRPIVPRPLGSVPNAGQQSNQVPGASTAPPQPGSTPQPQ